MSKMSEFVVNKNLTLNGEKGVRILWRKVNGPIPEALEAPDSESTLTIEDKNGDQILKRGFLDDGGLAEIVKQAIEGKLLETDILTNEDMENLLPKEL